MNLVTPFPECFDPLTLHAPRFWHPVGLLLPGSPNWTSGQNWPDQKPARPGLPGLPVLDPPYGPLPWC